MLQLPEHPQGPAFSSNWSPWLSHQTSPSYDTVMWGFLENYSEVSPKCVNQASLPFILYPFIIPMPDLPPVAFQRKWSADEFLQSRLGSGVASLLLCSRCLSCLFCLCRSHQHLHFRHGSCLSRCPEWPYLRSHNENPEFSKRSYNMCTKKSRPSPATEKGHGCRWDGGAVFI